MPYWNGEEGRGQESGVSVLGAEELSRESPVDMTEIDWRPQADGLWSGWLNGAGLQGDEEARLEDGAALEGGWEDDPM